MEVRRRSFDPSNLPWAVSQCPFDPYRAGAKVYRAYRTGGRPAPQTTLHATGGDGAAALADVIDLEASELLHQSQGGLHHALLPFLFCQHHRPCERPRMLLLGLQRGSQSRSRPARQPRIPPAAPPRRMSSNGLGVRRSEGVRLQGSL
jgi:hypothetical protein